MPENNNAGFRVGLLF